MTGASQGNFLSPLPITAKVFGPGASDLAVQLVRKDHLETSNIFRFCFEAALALFCTTLGYILPLDKVPMFQWVALAVCLIATLGFMFLSFLYYPRANMPK